MPMGRDREESNMEDSFPQEEDKATNASQQLQEANIAAA
jgi:hypothetical protein